MGKRKKKREKIDFMKIKNGNTCSEVI